MHEIRATLPEECVAEVLDLAHRQGISSVSVSDVWLSGPEKSGKQVSVETSTPRASRFVDAVLSSSSLKGVSFTLTSREVRAIVASGPVEELTRPLTEPLPDIVQDLWQVSHLTPTYAARALSGAMLLATGLIDNNPVSIVVAALFLPFLSQLLAVSFGAWLGERKLAIHGLKALGVSLVLAALGGAIVAILQGGPIQFDSFRSPYSSLGLSTLIGITAGLSVADDAGRRYLIGVAAAVQLAIFPVWFGAAAVLGFPPADVLAQRASSFAINFCAIALSSVGAYAALTRHTSRR